MRQPAPEPYWNTNVARHPGILRSVPEGCGDALEVGCGNGLLARKLAGRAKRVTGIDRSPDMIACARELAAGYSQLTFIEGDFLTTELPGAQYDFVCSVTTIHHMGFEAALIRMRELLRPGGTLVVVGLAREASVTEWAAFVAASPIVQITKALPLGVDRKTVRKYPGPATTSPSTRGFRCDAMRRPPPPYAAEQGGQGGRCRAPLRAEPASLFGWQKRREA
ncbi:class I SAM-dependent methyltransferase [Streptomyces sp. NPDC127119]|uniref:class I SAM-dependent methyltransferase n=1 Tax=Streptomyces sp. NPDC127119 TaxID=3345370 RepID=UPI0036435F72